MRISRIIGGLGLSLLAIIEPVAQACPTRLTTERVTSGLARPVYLVSPPGDFRRLFIVEQFSGSNGRIRIYDMETNQLQNANSPFLSVRVSTGGEQGLLGLAFHPDFANNKLFYVNFTDPNGHTIIREYKVSDSDPNKADTNSARQIIMINQPFSNHNGGWIDFGPDGYLHIGMGDGGSGNDPGNRGQNLTVLLGKFLRLDVNGDDFPSDNNKNYAIPADNPFVEKEGADEIWHYGVRNPWRNGFDRLTGDLYIGDVGQSALEEISFQAAGVGGINYGWRCREGTRCTGLQGCGNCSGFESEPPIDEYGHSNGRCSVTGGYVYRGKRIWDLRGTYFYSDYCTGEIWTFRYDGANKSDTVERTSELEPPGSPTINNVTSFGEDQRGELYIIDQDGEIFRVVPNGPVLGDMNADGRIDFDDIDGFSLALTDPEQYRSTYGVDPNEVGDINCDDAIDFDDVDPFVALIIAES